MESQELSVLSVHGCARLVMMRNIERNQESSTHLKTEMLKWEFLLRSGNECERKNKFFMQTVANVHFCQGLRGLYPTLANTTITTNLARLIKCLELWVWWAKHALCGGKWHWAYLVSFVANRNCEKQKLTSQYIQKKHSEHLGEQCDITGTHYSVNRTSFLQVWSHGWDLCTVVGPGVPDTEKQHTEMPCFVLYVVVSEYSLSTVEMRIKWPQRHWWDVSILQNWSDLISEA